MPPIKIFKYGFVKVINDAIIHFQVKRFVKRGNQRGRRVKGETHDAE